MATGPDKASEPQRSPREGASAGDARVSRVLRAVLVVTLALALAWFVVDKGWLSRPAAVQPRAAAGAATGGAAHATDGGVTATPHPVVAARSVAVLPFLNVSADREQGYFSDGVTLELCVLLGQVPNLHVPGSTSSFYFRGKQATIADIASKLAVAHVLEGSVNRSGATLRVTAQLTRADSGERLWSGTYDRDVRDVFKVEGEIASAVAEALKTKLVPSRLASNPRRTGIIDAYDEYLRGNSFQARGKRDGWRLAIAAYRKAIELDPNYAAAYAGLALAESSMADEIGDDAGNKRAMAAAERAVALAPGFVDAYAARGYLRYIYAWDWAGAQADFEKALKIDPDDPVALRRYAGLLDSLGRLPESLAVIRQLIKEDPLFGAAWMNLGITLYSAGQVAEAREALNRALAISPDSIYGQYHRGFVELIAGQPQKALGLFRQVGDPVFVLTGVAMAEHTLGHSTESQQAVGELVRTHARTSAFQIAEVYGWRGEKAPAFAWLERAYRQRDGGLNLVKTDPSLAALHDDPRFGAFLRKLKLPQ